MSIDIRRLKQIGTDAGLRLAAGILQNRVRVGAAAAVAVLALALIRRKSQKRPTPKDEGNARERSYRKPSARVDKNFLKNLVKLLKIIIPNWRSKEAGLLLIHSGFLVARTAASVYLANLDGQIVKALVAGDGREFAKKLIWWLAIAVPIAFVNSGLRFLQNKLSISFRSRLTKYVHDQYMSDLTFYKVTNLDTRIQNVDQCITQDVATFCNNLASLYSNLAKPAVDLILYNAKLAYNVGFKGLAVLTVLIHIGTFILRNSTPPFGRLVAEQQQLEGNFRFGHSRVITNSEEIAFYGGAETEKKQLDSSFQKLVNHMNKIFRAKLNYGTLESFIVKYYWGAQGFLICALPVFTPFGRPAGVTDDSLASRTRDFVTNRRLLLNTSDAFSRMMVSYKEISELAGYTARVAETLRVFEDMKNGVYQRGEMKGSLQEQGTVLASESIQVEHLDIVSPNNDVLVRDMSFEVPRGMHLMITGPNGCGKSSLFRILGGLWPISKGTVRKPILPNQIFYIPQRPYLSVGTLRDQVIYPHSLEEMKARGITDLDLDEIIEDVRLSYVVEREGGWNAVREWKDVLSGGEKQRIAMARLFYHKPKYAILDECTSAVAIDVEGAMYTKAKQLGISLMTVSHRPSLWKYHDFLLEFDGVGNYKFSNINDIGENSTGDSQQISKLTLDEERKQLEKRIRDDNARMNKIKDLLGSDQ
eukprot:TRINITY_DN2671_c0_g1_i1.p1 TRINITY_DN2671_c0_g1~~TRINITY_DN2671_c0_g1_i1.p1  ORF type:complete len:702 (+),score=181.95 TRINITY_DN2671_c0_g1_i1:86-2191(+)